MNAAAVNRFASIAARVRRELSPVTVQPYTGAPAYASTSGNPVLVFMSAVKAERLLGDAGYYTEHRAELRVLKTLAWVPVEGAEFVRTDTFERFRINTATGADSAFAREIVCTVVKITA
jgi:hypothetical protein